MVEQNGLHIDDSLFLVCENGNANIVNFILLILDVTVVVNIKNINFECIPPLPNLEMMIAKKFQE